MSIAFESTYKAFVDSEVVATVSRGYDDSGVTPLLVELVGVDGALVTEDAESAMNWLRALAILVDRSIAYGEIFDDISKAEAEVFAAERHDAEPVNSAYEVDKLTDAEADEEWEDNDGDHLRYIDGEWYVSDQGTGPWERVVDGDLLTDYAPYQLVK